MSIVPSTTMRILIPGFCFLIIGVYSFLVKIIPYWMYFEEFKNKE